LALCFFRSFCMNQLTHRRAVITGAAIIDGGLTVRWPD
jgi:hypothetical protein